MMVKLDQVQREILEKRIHLLNELHAEIKEKKAFQYDWQQLDAAIWNAIRLYQHIKNTNEEIGE